MKQEPIDLVYLWCDAADAKWTAKRMEAARACGLAADADGNLPCRFIARNELRYALRSAARYVPWVRKVFIVHDDDNELPRWLNRDNPRLQIVRHSEIMPARFLPCFCPITIEHYLAQIPDLSERFLYANDDMMFYRPLEPSFFFASDGYPYCRFGGKKKPMPEAEKSHYLRNIDRADELARTAYAPVGRELAEAISRYPHHCVDAYCKSDVRSCFARFKEVLETPFANPFRSPDKVLRVFYLYDAIAHGHGHFRLARFRIGSGRPWYKRLLRPGWADSLQFYGERWPNGPQMLKRWRPGLFCFNDTAVTTDADRDWLENLYAGMFPDPSSFEKMEGAR